VHLSHGPSKENQWSKGRSPLRDKSSESRSLPFRRCSKCSSHFAKTLSPVRRHNDYPQLARHEISGRRFPGIALDSIFCFDSCEEANFFVGPVAAHLIEAFGPGLTS
jgi:hypothetical protein